MPGDLGEALLQEMLSTSMSVNLANVSVLGVDHDVAEGNNYTADMSRVRARIVTRDGKKKDVSLLVKQCIDLDNDVLKAAAELKTEIKIYQDILPAMESVAMRLGSPIDTLWPHCIGHFDNTTLVLEDLQELGYTTYDRFRGLDYQHASVAVRGLARFHALSVSLRDSGIVKPSDFSNFIFGGRSESMNGFVTSSFEYLLAIATEEWSAEWKDIISNVKKIPELAIEKLREITSLELSKFSVLNHGDPWVNNMMFRHNTDGVPDSIRFVDFQLSHYNSYAFDLHYFVNTSLAAEILLHIDRLYEEYHDELVTMFSKLGLSGCPTLYELQEELQRTEFFGVFSAVCVAPVIMAGADIAPLKDSSGFTLAQLEQRKKERYRNEEYTRKIQVILRRAQHGGLFKRLFI